LKDTKLFQKFKKGSYYTRNDIHNFYLNIPIPRFGAGNWISGYVNPKETNDLIIFMNIDVPGKSGHNYKKINTMNLQKQLNGLENQELTLINQFLPNY
tara:strand:- start:313 stop:606 length:294 start_codon:yes stop_codon:yes gene_type:complete